MVQVASTRFSNPALDAPVANLIKKNNRIILWSLAITLFLHIAFVVIFSIMGEEEKITKPPVMRFVVRVPRSIKPLEVKKVKIRKQVEIKRKFSQVQLKKLQQLMEMGIKSSHSSMETFSNHGFSMDAVMAGVELGDGPSIQVIRPEKLQTLEIDRNLENLSLEDLNIGKHRALVIQNPQDKKSIQGFFNMALVTSPNIRYGLHGKTHLTEPAGLVKGVNKFSNIKVKLFDTVKFTDPKLYKLPFIYIQASSIWELDDIENEALGEYFKRGGFAYCQDSYYGKGGPSDICLRNLLRKALKNSNLKFEKIPNDHYLYHCYFDFESGPPPGADAFHPEFSQWKTEPPPYNYLEAVYVGDRMVAIMSNKDMGDGWHAVATGDDGTFSGVNLEPVQKFATNLVVFVLTQKGSITHQAMSAFK